MNKLTRPQSIALGTFLSEWPDEYTYDEVLQGLEDGDEFVGVWEPFEYKSTHIVIESIELLKENIEHAILEEKNK